MLAKVIVIPLILISFFSYFLKFTSYKELNQLEKDDREKGDCKAKGNIGI